MSSNSRSRAQRPVRDAAHTVLPPSRPFHQDAPAAPSRDAARHAGHDFRRVSVFPAAAIQRKGEGEAGEMGDVPVAAGGGEMIPDSVRAAMEGAFAQDFGDVRVHTGPEARQVGALAYTRGSDLHFQPGRYDPFSQSGRSLLGHELTHVVQQRAGRVNAPQQNKAEGAAPINADAGLEAEADAQGAKAARGERASVSGAGAGLQRKGEDAPIQRWPEWLGAAAGMVGSAASGAFNAIAHPIDTATGLYHSVMGGPAPAVAPPGGNPGPAAQTPEEAAKEAEIGRLTGRNLTERVTDSKVANPVPGEKDIWSEVPAAADAKYDYTSLKGTPGLKGTTDAELAEKQYAAEMNNRKTAAEDISTTVKTGPDVKDVKQVGLHQSGTWETDKEKGTSAYAPSDQHVPDPASPGKLDPARGDVLKSLLISNGRAKDDSAAPLPSVKAIDPALKDGKSAGELAADQPYQDALTDLRQKRPSGIDDVKREKTSGTILTGMQKATIERQQALAPDAPVAHPVSAHGPGTDQIPRLVSGRRADQVAEENALPVGDAKATPAGTSALTGNAKLVDRTIPAYGTAGDDVSSLSSAFSSNVGMLHVMEDAYSQASVHDAAARETADAAYAAQPPGGPLVTPAYGDSFVRDIKGKSKGFLPEGIGQSFSLPNPESLPKIEEGQPLNKNAAGKTPEQVMQERYAAVETGDNLRSAKVVMRPAQINGKNAGWDVQTAFPTNEHPHQPLTQPSDVKRETEREAALQGKEGELKAAKDQFDKAAAAVTKSDNAIAAKDKALTAQKANPAAKPTTIAALEAALLKEQNNKIALEAAKAPKEGDLTSATSAHSDALGLVRDTTIPEGKL